MRFWGRPFVSVRRVRGPSQPGKVEQRQPCQLEPAGPKGTVGSHLSDWTGDKTLAPDPGRGSEGPGVSGSAMGA